MLDYRIITPTKCDCLCGNRNICSAYQSPESCSMSSSNEKNLILDMTNINNINSDFCKNIIVSEYKLGKRVWVIGIRQQPLKVFEILNIDKKINFAKTIEEAINKIEA